MLLSSADWRAATLWALTAQGWKRTIFYLNLAWLKSSCPTSPGIWILQYSLYKKRGQSKCYPVLIQLIHLLAEKAPATPLTKHRTFVCWKPAPPSRSNQHQFSPPLLPMALPSHLFLRRPIPDYANTHQLRICQCLLQLTKILSLDCQEFQKPLKMSKI